MFSQNRKYLKPLWCNGPTPGEFYDFPNRNSSFNNFNEQKTSFGVQHKPPITTGTSVFGLQFEGGVMLAADNLVSYGSLSRYQEVKRVFKINELTILGFSGNYADFQYIKRDIDHKIIEEYCYSDNMQMKPKSLCTALTRNLYNRRSKNEPLWLDIVIGGLQEGAQYLAHADLRGRSYEDDCVATGIGKFLALPLLREQVDGKPLLKKEKALELIQKCMEVCYYRDCRSLCKYSVAICSKKETTIYENLEINQNWNLARLIDGY